MAVCTKYESSTSSSLPCLEHACIHTRTHTPTHAYILSHCTAFFFRTSQNNSQYVWPIAEIFFWYMPILISKTAETASSHKPVDTLWQRRSGAHQPWPIIAVVGQIWDYGRVVGEGILLPYCCCRGNINWSAVGVTVFTSTVELAGDRKPGCVTQQRQGLQIHRFFFFLLFMQINPSHAVAQTPGI